MSFCSYFWGEFYKTLTFNILKLKFYMQNTCKFFSFHVSFVFWGLIITVFKIKADVYEMRVSIKKSWAKLQETTEH